MEDEGIPGEPGNQVHEPRELCFDFCTTPLSELTRASVFDLQVGEPARGFYLLLRTLKPTIKGAIDFKFGPNLLVMVEDHDVNCFYFCLHAHVHLRSEAELEDLLPPNTVFVLKEPSLVACPEEQFVVVVGSPSDFVIVGCSHVLYTDAVALGWRPILENDGTNDFALAWKDIGDTLFEREELDEALDVYLFTLTIGGDDVTNLMLNLNLALVYLALGYYERAIMHCHTVLETDETNDTALYLVGLAHYELRQFLEAKYYFQMVPTDSPFNELAETELVRCQERLREAAGIVNVLELFRACQTDLTTPIDHGNFARNMEFRLGPDNEGGVYATQDLAPGTLILVEKPIVVTFEQPHLPSQPGHVVFMRTAFRALMKNPKSVGQKLYGLSGGDDLADEDRRIFCDEVNGLEPILDVLSLYCLITQNIVKTMNCVVQNGPCSYQVYEEASRFRHSCLSNCTLVVYKDVITLRTCTQVWKGEELTVYFYGNDLSVRDKRKIFERIGYECNCHLCYLDRKETTEVHNLREELMVRFCTQLGLHGSDPDAAELNLLPIIRELEVTYEKRHSLRSHLCLAYWKLAKVLKRTSDHWRRKVYYYVAASLGSVGLSVGFLFSLADEVNPQIRALMPEVLFEYAAIMLDLSSRRGRPDLVSKWIKVLLVLERVYTGGNVEMLMHRFPGFRQVQYLLSAHAQDAVQRCT